MSDVMRPVVLCFSGSDSFGAAGAQADLKTIRAHDCHTTQVITAITAQSHTACRSVFPVHEQELSDQVLALKAAPKPAVIKIGMTGSIDALKVIRTASEDLKVPVILDPVLASSSGRNLAAGVSAEDFLSLATVCNLMLTPNTVEAEFLSGVAIKDVTDMPVAAAAILEKGARQVIIKGGHLPHHDQFVFDYYADRSGQRFFLRSKRRPIAKLRGTGCTFASALAARIAEGHEITDAVVLARAYLNQCFDQAVPCADDIFLINHKRPDLRPDLMPEVFPEYGPDRNFALTTELPVSPAHSTGFYVIADSAAWVEKLVAWGVPTIQLRVKHLSGDQLKAEITRAVSAARHSSSALYINDYWQEAIAAGAFGVHIGQEDLETADLRAIKKAGLRLGLSTHSWYEAAVAATCRPSYIALGPVFPTTCKSMRFGPQGFAKLRQWKEAWNIPLVAIGGLTLEHAPVLRELGCEGAAVISDILKDADPASRTAAWLTAFYSAPLPPPQGEPARR